MSSLPSPAPYVKDPEIRKALEILWVWGKDIEGRVLSGNNSPENLVAAPVGTLYRRLDGGANTTLYVKESGTGNTGWTAK